MEYQDKYIYRCPYCLKEYTSFEDCQICIYNCADTDTPIEEKITLYVCGYCGEEFRSEKLCEECEKEHETNQDEFYSRIKLKEAGEHPSQNKLF